MSQFKPTRALLNVNFEGYKLSEEPLRSVARALPAAVGTARLRSDQFSFQHVRAFSLHNHLVADPFDEARVYWYGEDEKIYSARFEVYIIPARLVAISRVINFILFPCTFYLFPLWSSGHVK